MKYFFRTIIVAGIFVVPAVTHADVIRAFNVDMTVHKDSSVDVVETINYDFGTSTRHGIFRSISTKHPESASRWYLEHYIDVSVLGVTRDGSKEPFVEDDQRDRVYLKIGDPNSTIGGYHTYVISYHLRGAMSFIPNGGAEFYWNALPTEGNVPILSAQVDLHDPDGILTSDRACYLGRVGGTGTCGATVINKDSVTFTATRLKPGETMTIQNAVKRSKVQEVVLERYPAFLPWVVGLSLWFIALLWWAYRYKTKNRTGNPIIAEYEPYGDVKPMYTGVLMDGRLDARDITAGIIYLAGQGYLKIKKTERKVMFFFDVDDYEIALLRPVSGAPSNFGRELLTMLFSSDAVAGETVTLHELKSDKGKQQANARILQDMREALEQDLVDEGYFQELVPSLTVFVSGLFMFIIVGYLFQWMWGMHASIHMWVLIVSIIVSVMIIGLALYRRRTRKGYEALDHLEGFKLFLSVTDKERMDFHNAPEKSPEQFMEFLPYAIAFGVEKKWAKVFEDITIPNPGWYDAGSTGTSFSAINLTTSLGAFAGAFSQSSGSSGSSGVGGGFAGGGGGGGSVGSW